jgi:cell division protein FtsL
MFTYGKKRMQGISRKGGLSLVEVILYSVLVVIMLVVIVNVLVVIMKSYRQISSAKSVQSAAITSVERLGQEIRRAKTIASASTGSLILNTTDSAGNNETMEFRLSDGQIYLYEAGSNLGALTPASATVTSLIFQTITAGSNSAVRITETVESGSGESQRTATFYSTVELRQ